MSKLGKPIKSGSPPGPAPSGNSVPQSPQHNYNPKKDPFGAQNPVPLHSAGGLASAGGYLLKSIKRGKGG
jgi:hypothetical protein